MENVEEFITALKNVVFLNGSPVNRYSATVPGTGPGYTTTLTRIKRLPETYYYERNESVLMWENIQYRYSTHTTALPVDLWMDIWLESKYLKKVDVDNFK